MKLPKLFYFLLLALSIALNIQQKYTSEYLLAINADLIGELEKPHAIHDADITAWIGKDKKLTVVVNGAFMHRYDVTCYEGSVGRL